MSRRIKIAFFLFLLFGFLAIGLVMLFHKEIAVLSPNGMIGQQQSRLLLIATVLMLIVVIPVFALTFGIAWKYRNENQAKYHPDWEHSTLAEVIWWSVPFLIVIVLALFTWKGCHDLDPFKPIASKVKPIKIQVVALRWKWLFIYPEQGIATVNYLQFPKEVPLNFEITSDAPMNSFWIPQLGGQVYAMAGMKSRLHLVAGSEGDFRGSSANISGEGFSGMKFVAKATSQEGFDEWVEGAKNSPVALTKGEYKELVKPSEYNAPATYRLADGGLFDAIIMKYMMPMAKHE